MIARVTSPGAIAFTQSAGILQAAGTWRIFAPESTRLAGASFAVGFRLRPTWLSIHADAAGGWGAFSDPLGNGNVAVYSGGVSLLAASGRRPELEVGPHLELGYARAVGLASGPNSIGSHDGRAIALISVTTAARFWFDRWAAFVAMDLGTTLLGAEIFAADRRAAAVHGAFGGARAGVAFGY